MNGRRFGHITSSILRLWPNTGDNRAEIEKDGTIVFKGEATVWDDLAPNPVTVGVGAAAPSFTTYSGNFSAYEFVGAALMKEMLFCFQFRHGYKEGTDVTPHIHLFVPNDATGGVIKFGCEYSWVNKGGAEPASTTVYGTLTIGATAGNLGNEHLSFGAISGVGKTISSLLTCRIFRDSTDVADTFGSSVWLKSADTHHAMDTVASRGITTK